MNSKLNFYRFVTEIIVNEPAPTGLTFYLRVIE
jgi:hypothetical protein